MESYTICTFLSYFTRTMLPRLISAAIGVRTSSLHRLNDILLHGWITLCLPLHLLRVAGGVSAFQPLCKRQWTLPRSRGVRACNTQQVLWGNVGVSRGTACGRRSVGSAPRASASLGLPCWPCQAEPCATLKLLMLTKQRHR